MRIPDDARAELVRFWGQHPDLRAECKRHYGFDPVRQEQSYWEHGLPDEPEHKDVLAAVRAADNTFTLPLVKRWEHEELAAAKREKVGKVANVELHLRVVGMQTHPSGQRVYRLATRDGHYVGRTNPSRVRALKGDVLKVQAAHLRMTQAGDVDWTNVEVAGTSAARRANSRRDLLDRVNYGETPDMTLLGKDGVPPAGDEGDVDPEAAKNIPLGPTANSVHVDSPMPTISVYYGRKPKRLKVVKAFGGMQQLIYGIVLEPDVIDSQGDFVPGPHVEKAAHNYMKKVARGRASVSKLQHRLPAFRRDKPSVVPVESFIAPVDFTYPGSKEPVKRGSWVMVVHVEDPQIWQDVLDGHYGGFSIGGTGKRERVGGGYNPPPPPF